MADVEIYTKTGCPYCSNAKDLLDSLGVQYVEKVVDDPDDKDRLVQRTNHQTVPQIFINDEFIGGYDDLKALNEEGRLDEMLNDFDEDEFSADEDDDE